MRSAFKEWPRVGHARAGGMECCPRCSRGPGLLWDGEGQCVLVWGGVVEWTGPHLASVSYLE